MVPTHANSKLRSLPWRGVGLVFNRALQPFVLDHPEAFDFLEIMPDTHWLEQSSDGHIHYVDDPAAVATLARLRAEDRAMVIHGLGLSIGTAERFDREHLAHVGEWVARLDCAWHSEHLAATRIYTEEGERVDVGFPMAVPYDREVLEMIVERVAAIQAEIPVPFLVENNVYYYRTPGQDMSEAAFLNQLCRRTGCGLLLDLHNLYVNARNHGFDPAAFIDELDLDQVVEVHVAGGIEWQDYYLDAHSGACPEPVWALLDDLIPRAPCLRAVTFELFPDWWEDFGTEALLAELNRIRSALTRAGMERARVTG